MFRYLGAFFLSINILFSATIKSELNKINNSKIEKHSILVEQNKIPLKNDYLTKHKIFELINIQSDERSILKSNYTKE